jgi:hypothetical protein
MSLAHDLQTVAENLDPSLQPSSNDVGPLLGALIAYTEHGDKVVKAAEQNGAAGVSELLSGTKPEPSSSSGKGESSSSGKGER